MRILKAEAKGLREDDVPTAADQPQPPTGDQAPKP
jgi:hypothetical protein